MAQRLLSLITIQFFVSERPMLNGFYMSAAGMIMQDRKHEVIANNIANMNTAGFKKDTLCFQEMLSENAYHNRPATQLNRVASDIGGGLLLDSTRTSFAQGSFRNTGSDFNLALKGEGFFKFSDGQKHRYTRCGYLELDAEGYLVSPADPKLRLMNTNDAPIYVGNSRFKVVRDGTVVLDGAPASRIKVADFADPNRLSKTGNNMFAAGEGQAEQNAVDYSLVQGYLEQSNADGISEMVNLIQASRAYETNATFIRNQDSALNAAINTLGRV